MENAYKILDGRVRLGGSSTGGTVSLRWILKKYRVKVWIQLIQVDSVTTIHQSDYLRVP